MLNIQKKRDYSKETNCTKSALKQTSLTYYFHSFFKNLGVSTF